MCLPRVVVARALDTAQRAGTFVAASAPGIGEVLAWASGTAVALLGLRAQRAPARAFGSTSGLMRGLYLLPAGGTVAWWVRHAAAALPALVLDDGYTFDVCLSYATEDLHAATALRDALLGAGLRVYLLDVRTDPNDPEWWLPHLSAIAVSTWFVPLPSRHDLERAGSEVEAAEAREGRCLRNYAASAAEPTTRGEASTDLRGPSVLRGGAQDRGL
jgi:hypothetical protein